VGWKLGLFSNVYAFGIASNTLVAKIGSPNWFSVFGSNNPAGNASSTGPDTNSVVSFGSNRNGLFTGSVGIGTSAPSYLLHVGSPNAVRIVADFQNSSGYCTFNPSSSGIMTTCTSDMRLK